MPGDDPSSSPERLGRIALKQVRVSRADVEARAEARAREGSSRTKASNPMNRLVPYLDLFGRLSDDELARLARAPVNAVEGLRQQVDDINRALGRFADLLPRLNDDELARLTGASLKTIRFWRLSQPRHMQGDARRRESSAPQPIPRRESTAYSSSEDESSSRRSNNTTSHNSVGMDSVSFDIEEDDPDPGDSSTFVIDTVE